MQEQKFNLKQLQEIIGQITARMTQLHKSIAKIKEQVEPVIKEYQQSISFTLKNAQERSSNKLQKLFAFNRAFATGGLLRGYGGGDNVPARLESGEFVIRKEAVRKYGANIFSALNRMKFNRDTFDNAIQNFIAPLANMVEKQNSNRMAFNFPDLENLPIAKEKNVNLNLTINNKPIGTLRGSQAMVDALVTVLRRERLTTIR